MTSTPEDPRAALDQAILDAAGSELGLGHIVVVHSTGSTNADLVRAVEAGTARHFDVLTCEHQTAGRGRLERGWQVPEGAALTVSIVINPQPQLPLPALSWYTMIAALAWCEAIEREAGLAGAIKWPNDVLVGAKKVCGILAQLAVGDHGPAVVVGTGMNVDQRPEELPVPTATSLRLAAGRPVDRSRLLAAYLRSFHALDAEFRAAAGDAQAPLAGQGGSSLRELAGARLATAGQRVRIDYPDGTSLQAQALGLEGDGALRVRDDAGTVHRVLAGDVHHVRRSDGRYA